VATREFPDDQFEPRLMALDEPRSLKEQGLPARRMNKTLNHVAGVRVRLRQFARRKVRQRAPLIERFDERGEVSQVTPGL